MRVVTSFVILERKNCIFGRWVKTFVILLRTLSMRQDFLSLLAICPVDPSNYDLNESWIILQLVVSEALDSKGEA